MKLIFNKGNQGSAELKAMLGFIDAGVNYSNLERFLWNSVYEINQLIGKDWYEVITDLYFDNDLSEAGQEDNKRYVEALQFSIAIDAYRKFAPSRDVGHTQDGRKMRLDEHEKMPFEWLIDRDNENMERMYYQSLDQLLGILEEVDGWTESPQYQKLTTLFVHKTSQFEEHFNINNSRLLLLKLYPGLRQCEAMSILPRLGQDLITSLKADPSSDPELYALVQEACVYHALAWAMKGRLTVTLFPEGVLQRYISDRATTQGKKPPMANEYAWAAQSFTEDSEFALKRIEAHLEPEPEEDETIETLPPIGFCESDKFIST